MFVNQLEYSIFDLLGRFPCIRNKISFCVGDLNGFTIARSIFKSDQVRVAPFRRDFYHRSQMMSVLNVSPAISLGDLS